MRADLASPARPWRFLAALRHMAALAWSVHPAGFTGALVLAVLQAAFPLAMAWITKLLFDRLGEALAASAPLPWRELGGLLALQIALTIVMQAFGPLTGYLYTELSRRLMLRVQGMVYETIHRPPGIAHFEDPKFHDAIQLALQGAQGGPPQILQSLMNGLRHILTLGGFLGVLLSLSPVLAGLALAAALPQLAVTFKASRRRYGIAVSNTPRERLFSYYGAVLSMVQFAKELRLFGLADHFLGRFLRTGREINDIHAAQQRYEIRWQIALNALTAAVSGGALALVVFQVFQGTRTLGDLPFLTSAIDGVLGALGGLVAVIGGLDASVLFYNRFTDLLSLPGPSTTPEDRRPVPALRRGIELQGVSFRYSEQHPWVLRDLHLSIPAGRSLALVGVNGAGKTSLVKLLTRLYEPTEGRILWDGVDLRDLDPAELRTRIGVILQDFVRYDLSARENIGLGDLSLSGDDEAIRRAAREAGVHDLLERLPRDYDTVLSRWLGEGEVGTDLSGGEWQKVALARLFLRNADVLILDEPTAALDAQAEHEIFDRFDRLVDGRTSLMISHRLNTVRMADCIVVLEDGRITEMGSHRELRSRGGTYDRLYTLQAQRYETDSRPAS